MSNSRIEEMSRYLRTRIARRRLLLLWLLLVAAWLAAAAQLPPPGLPRSGAFLLLSIVVFRLWDDLADRTYDRQRHPQRVLVASNSAAFYAIAVVTGLGVLALLLLDDRRSLGVFLTLLVVLTLLYHSAPGKRLPRPLRSGIVLAKYPVFVLLVAGFSLRAWLAGLGVFFVLAVNEWRDDQDLRSAPVMQLLAGAATGIAIVSALYLSAGVRP